MHKVRTAETAEDIERCFDVMALLRPHIRREDFVDRILSQMQDGYRLTYIQDQDIVVAVAGYRILSNLGLGKFLYVDDMVTHEDHRSKGFGKILLDWLIEEARESGCSYLDLDSGVQRTDAHRFYEREGMERSSYHFRLRIDHERK